MNAPTICCFGVWGSFDYRHIGGTDSYFRRLALGLVGRGYRVAFLHYGSRSDATESPVPGLDVFRYVRLEDALARLAALDGPVLVATLLRKDRVRFLCFRRRQAHRRRFYFVASVFYESWWRRTLYFLEAMLCPYNGRVLAMSPRLARAARCRGNRAEVLLPPVPEHYFVRPENKARGEVVRAAYVGRTVAGKGVTQALAVWERLRDAPNVRTAVHGYISPTAKEDPSIHNALRADPEMAYTWRNYDSWTPEVDRDMAATLKDIDVLILPYRKLSSTIDMPLLLLEGMAANCVVITKRLGDMPAVYGSTAFMPPEAGFVDEAARQIRSVHEHLDGERRRVADQAAGMGFNTATVVDRLVSTLELPPASAAS